MGSLRTWSLALVAGIFVVIVAHHGSNANAGEGAAAPAASSVAAPGGPASPAIPTAPAGRVTGLPDFSGLVAANGAAVVNISVVEKPQGHVGGSAGGDEGGGNDEDPLSQLNWAPVAHAWLGRMRSRVPTGKRRPLPPSSIFSCETMPCSWLTALSK